VNNVRHYRHGRRSFGHRNNLHFRNSLNNQTNTNLNLYSKVQLQDIYNDKFFRNQVNWGLIVEEYQKNFPKEKSLIWDRVEGRLKTYLANHVAVSKKTSIFFRELLKIKQEYYDFKKKYNTKSSRKSVNSSRNSPNSRQSSNVKTVKITKDSRISKSFKLNKIDQEKVKNLTKNYIPFAKILSDKLFVKVTGVNTIQFSKDTNWKQFDQKLLNFMKNRLLNRVNLKKKENIFMKRFEEIQYSYQYYIKNKSIKENVKSLDSLLPKKQFLSTKDQAKTVKKTESTKIVNIASYCNVDCVGICQHNFKSYKDFISCSKQACLCSEYDILSKKAVDCEVNNRHYELLCNDDSIII